ncbi:MAG TPA: YdcF family protein [Aggregatilineales bacterium]|nr:YdcF family protein [Aggregatilineales bacterium]
MLLSRIAARLRTTLARFKNRRTVIILLIAAFVAFNALAGVVYSYGQTDRAAPSDVIVILGAGVHPDGSPTQAHMRRVAHAITLYRQGLAPYLLCTGGYDRPSDVKTEAETCVELLELAQVPSRAILREDLSTSTEENAIQAHKVIAAHDLKSAILVSDNYHLLRATILFQMYGMSVSTSPAQASMGPIDWKRGVFSAYREVLALGWLAGKSLLHLPFARTPKG